MSPGRPHRAQETPEARVVVRVQPRAARDEIVGFVNNVLQVRVKSPPLQGKANQALVSLLAEALDIRKGQVSIISGHASRQKVVAIEGIEASQVETWLRSLLPAGPEAAHPEISA